MVTKKVDKEHTCTEIDINSPEVPVHNSTTVLG